MISETSLLQSQVPAGDMTVTSTDFENSAIDCTGKMTKPRFTEFLCSYQEVNAMNRLHFNHTESRAKVVNYVASVTSAVIPRSLWGSSTNYSRVLQSEYAVMSNGRKVDSCREQWCPGSLLAVDMKRLTCTRSCKDLVQMIVIG